VDGFVTVNPHCGPCHNYLPLRGGPEEIKTVWLAPTVIKKGYFGIRIVWRCNYGKTCQANCIYAKPENKEKEEIEDE